MAASAALKQSIERARAQVESLQAAVVNIWHTIGPHALASLKLSPRELESFLRRVTLQNPVSNLHQYILIMIRLRLTADFCSLIALRTTLDLFVTVGAVHVK